METPETQRQRERRPRKRKYLIRKVRPARLPEIPTEPPVSAAFPLPRHAMIRRAAEQRALARGGEGDPDRDWMEAEAEVEARLGDSRPF